MISLFLGKNNALCIICEMEHHVNHVFNGPRLRSLCPRAIVGNLKAIAKHMKLGRQEDSHEFMRFLLDSMCKNALYGLDSKMDHKLKETTVLHQIFGGRFQSRITCLQCKNVSDTEDAFMDICLDVKRADSVARALRHFSFPEKLIGENQYFCSKCKKKMDAEKRITVSQAPIVLTLQLKRFAFRGYGNDQKIAKHITFTEHLDLSPNLTESHSRAHYTLSSLLVHSGHTCHSGHYYSYVRSPNNIWYLMDDCSVHPVGITSVLRQSAYILIYTLDRAKGQTIAPTLPKPQLLPSSSKASPETPVSNKGDTTLKSPKVSLLKTVSETLTAASEPKSSEISGKIDQNERMKNSECAQKTSTSVKRKSFWIEGSKDDTTNFFDEIVGNLASKKNRPVEKPLNARDLEYDRGRIAKKKKKSSPSLSSTNPFQQHYESQAPSTKQKTDVDFKRMARHEALLDKFFK
jgi:hypothetical protein